MRQKWSWDAFQHLCEYINSLSCNSATKVQCLVLQLPYSALRTASVHTYLAGEFIVEEDVPGSKVSVDKAFLGKVAHAISDVLRELDKH